MKNLFILSTVTLVFLTLSFTSIESAAAPNDQWVRGVAVGARPTVDNWRERPTATTCNLTDKVSVERFFARPVTGSDSGSINVKVLVDGKGYGTETLSFRQPDSANAARIEVLRFQPLERLRLLELAAEGALVEIQSDDLEAGTLPLNMLVELRDDSPSASLSIPEATITSSTWRKGKSDRDQNGLRNIFADQTYEECVYECRWVEEDCISYYNCHWDDDQCLWQCEQEEIECKNECPCTGVDPILVNQYTVESTIAVSDRLAVICAGNIFSIHNKTYYDVYDFVDRTETYRVWEDCHGVQTTELISVVDSAVYTCHVYTGQICSSSPGTPPFCVIN